MAPDPDSAIGPQVERDRLDGLIPVVYEELRGLAGLLLSDKAANLTLQPTSLVHEVYLRLLDQRRVDWQDRLHFLRIAAKVMRRVLVDQCRARVAKKRAGIRVALEEVRWGSLPRPPRRPTSSPSTAC